MMFAKLKKKIEIESNIELNPSSLLNSVKEKTLSKILSDSSQSLPQDVSKSQKKSSEQNSLSSRRQSFDGISHSPLHSIKPSGKEDLSEEVKKLRRENKILRDHNKICTSTSGDDLDNITQLRSYEELIVKKQEELEEANRCVSDLKDQLNLANTSRESKLSKDQKSRFEEEVVNLKQEVLKTGHTLEEKDNSNIILQEKVEFLEKRLADLTSPNVDHNSTLKTERDILERKLFDTRTELTEIKSSWSDKINALERQITNFTSKMAEDRNDHHQIVKDYKTKISTISNQKQELEKELKQKNIMEDIYKKQLGDSKEKNRNLDQRITQLESKLNDEKMSHKKEIEIAQEKIRDLESKQLDQLEKDLEVEKHLCSQENMISHYKHNQLDKEHTLKSSEMTSHQDELEKQKALIESLSKEKANLLQQTMDLSRENDDIKKDRTEHISKLEEELAAANLKVQELSSNVIESKKVKELEVKIGDLENQLEEKNMNLKLNQKRLNDMKKTLQKELRGHCASDEEIKTVAQTPINNDINFQYLKHVVFRFMTASNDEAQQLIKPIAVILRFTKDEEKSLRMSFELRSSWFNL